MSKLWIDKKWVSLLSGTLEKFKWITNDVANFRCPICGDSDKSEIKARGYLFPYKDHYQFKCHNCGESPSLNSLIRQEFPERYREYRLERFKNEGSKSFDGWDLTPKHHQGTRKEKETVRHAHRLSDLSSDHVARRYAESRKIPEEFFDQIYFTGRFSDFLAENGIELEKPNDPRLIFPLLDFEGGAIGFQGRALEKGRLRYLTLKKSEDDVKVYGLDRINTGETVNVFEGPIDSLFIPNSVASCGSDLSTLLNTFPPRTKFRFCFDNEPRSKETKTKIWKAIETGHEVVFWSFPSSLKDVNDMILAGYSQSDVLSDMKKNAFSGLKARTEFTRWKA